MDRLRAFRRVDDEVDLVVVHRVDTVRATFEHLVDAADVEPVLAEVRGGAVGADEREPEVDRRRAIATARACRARAPRGTRHPSSVASCPPRAGSSRTRARSPSRCPSLRRSSASRGRGSCRHLRTSQREHDLFDRDVARLDLSRPSSASVLPAMIFAAIFASGLPIALLTNGIVRDARGFTSSTKTSPS